MRIALTVFACLGLLALSACQPKAPGPAARTQSALDVMEKVAVGANRCWMKSGDAAFKAYEMAPELNSFSGKPRFLLVRRGSRDIRPVLVVQAEGRPAKLSAFGPMMGEPTAARIAADVKRWAAGDKGC
ncbi:hypothetical protein HGO38_26405 [Rhizobium sp. CG5]|uniref:hypothetical protein n=1 Tax=Rhizobium sp. CG5 TaxID=2726076 RepID=UPI0020339530|nr:hypothetical protein [Rhizobium sp. CG5]MCM2476986.1 hypothetical protein [Rhizobium sp. CG5]